MCPWACWWHMRGCVGAQLHSLLLASTLLCLLVASALQCLLLASALQCPFWFRPALQSPCWFRPVLQCPPGSVQLSRAPAGSNQLFRASASVTAEEIQGLTSNPENFLFRGHRKCNDSVHLSVVWKRLQSGLQSPAESCALSWALANVSSFYCHLASASGAWWQKLRDLGGASSPRPSGS